VGEGGQHGKPSVVVGALHVERVRAIEAEDDSILIVHPHPGRVVGERANHAIALEHA